MIDSERLCISFSGGRTSAVMTDLLLKKYPDKEIQITFANTGLEHPDTLRFVNDCDRHLFGGRVVWLEAVTDKTPGIGVTHKVVNYETAATNGEPYRQSVEKNGLFNNTSPQCTGRLKIDPMKKYLQSIGWKFGKKIDHCTAVGIRADEADRISSQRKQRRLVYPMVEWGFRKQHVIDYCKAWPFDLTIDEHYGNCVGCWKKSFRKLATIAKENPHFFDWWSKTEDEFKNLKTAVNHDPATGFRRIYRGNKTVDDLFNMKDDPDFRPFSSKEKTHRQLDLWNPLDQAGACGESCEVFADENWPEENDD
tara:strand:- start:4229 stop:5152 length:924 start_codon:yes stop_codon:yes gene_type:complete